MDRQSKQEDQEQRALAYQRGSIALANSVRAFKAFTFVDLAGDIDTSGRRMGQEPYIKLTASRLAEITARLRTDVEGQVGEPTLAKVFRLAHRPVR